jgi:hypothetical protein
MPDIDGESHAVCCLSTVDVYRYFYVYNSFIHALTQVSTQFNSTSPTGSLFGKP